LFDEVGKLDHGIAAHPLRPDFPSRRGGGHHHVLVVAANAVENRLTLVLDLVWEDERVRNPKPFEALLDVAGAAVRLEEAEKVVNESCLLRSSRHPPRARYETRRRVLR